MQTILTETRSIHLQAVNRRGFRAAGLLTFCLMALSPALRAQTCGMILGNVTVAPSSPVYSSLDCIQASGAVTVNGSAAVTFQAANTIYFLPGFDFSGASGSSLTAQIAAVTQVATPAITGSTAGNPPVTTVTIGTATAGANIRFTTDGSSIPAETAGTLYQNPFTIAATTAIKAIAYKSGMADSQVSSNTITVQAAAPAFSPAPGTYTSPQAVSLSTATSGAVIHYTTDGSAPTASSAVFSIPIVVTSGTVTIRAYATASGLVDSSPVSGTYTVNTSGGGSSGTQTTNYTYDWMNNLTGVSMQRGSTTQTRAFTYDDAGRLTSGQNPENGTTLYYYNADNTLQYKHDAKGQETLYTYDSKKRVMKIQRFPNGQQGGAEDTCQQVTYTYDANPVNSSYSANTAGRLTTAQYNLCVANAANVAPGQIVEMYSYHPAGGVTGKRVQVTRQEFNQGFPTTYPTANLDVTYTYTSSGQVATVAYPTYAVTCCSYQPVPTQFTYTYDTMGRPTGLQDDGAQNTNNEITWVQNAQYDYASRLTNWQHYAINYTAGGTLSMGVKEMETYNVNGQLSSIAWSDPNTSASLGGEQYNYSPTANNGQITNMVDTIRGETVTYQYDVLKRLTSASTASWAQNFQYDGFGNLTGKTLNGASTATLNVDPATNRLTQASYDGNGNMLSGAGAAFTYDEANRATSATVTSGGTEYYGYAPDNKRIYRLKTDGQTEEFTFYGAQGERLGVYQQLGLNGTPYFQPLRKTVWFAGRKIWEDQASGTGAGQVYENRLKSNRNSGGYYPYGEEISGTTNDRTKFGSYNRDSFTGFDYADQRFYASGYGRFNTADPSISSVGPQDPASWNRYSYTRGDPVNRIDPRGLDDCDPNYNCYCDLYGDCYTCGPSADAFGAGALDSVGCGTEGGGGGAGAAPSCSISVANSGMPINGQTISGFGWAPPSQFASTLGPYSTVGNPAYPNLLNQGWWNAVQVQGVLQGDTNPADWIDTQNVLVSGSLQVAFGNATQTTAVKQNGIDDPQASAIYTASGAFDWIDAPGIASVIPGGGDVVGGKVTFNFTSTLADRGASCSVNWGFTLNIPSGTTAPIKRPPVVKRPPKRPR